MDSKQLKLSSIRFARSLQTLIKMVNMFSADHKSASGLLQRSYEFLNPLLKQSRSLTLGFIDQRILLNNILTTEEGLKPLENEFLRRGIGAVTFEAGITVGAYRTAIATLAANPKLIEDAGGLAPFLDSRPLEFVRIFPALKAETRNQEGDTVLDVGSEEYLISKALSSMNSGFSQGIETMLTRMEAGLGSGSGNGSGNGVGGGNGNGLPGFGGTGGAGTGTGSGKGRAGGPGFGGNSSGAPGTGGSLMDIQRVVEQKFEASLKNPEEDPHKAYVELGKMLSTIRPDVVVSNLMSAKGGQEASKDEVTAEVFENTALHWALKRLATMPTGEDAVVVEEQVFRVLMRSLQATQTAARLAQKLAEFAKQYALPPETLARIQDEIRWLSLTPKHRLRELLGIAHFSPAEFRRALDLIKELIRMGSHEDAAAIGVQYLTVFQDHLALRIDDVARVPELLRTLAGVQGEFWDVVADCLVQAIGDLKVNKLIHLQVANALIALARIAATYENFELVRRVGNCLEESIAQDPQGHAACCRAALTHILQSGAVDRLAEIFLEKKNDSAWIKTASALLRWAGPDAMERLFARLDNEQVASYRLALIRLLGRLGPMAVNAARQRLSRTEWYIVRNACKILSELKDPDLLQHIAPAFAHKDERVQKAALRAVIGTRLPQRAAVLANALPLLSPALLEDALMDLTYQGEPESLPGLEHCYSLPMPSSVLVRLVNVIAAVQHQNAIFLLARICNNQQLPQPVRDAAVQAIEQRNAKRGQTPAPQNSDAVETSEMPITKLLLRGA